MIVLKHRCALAFHIRSGVAKSGVVGRLTAQRADMLAGVPIFGDRVRGAVIEMVAPTMVVLASLGDVVAIMSLITAVTARIVIARALLCPVPIAETVVAVARSVLAVALTGVALAIAIPVSIAEAVIPITILIAVVTIT